MRKKNIIADDYYNDQEFIVGDIEDDFIVGILGKDPSADQIIKFELCSCIAKKIKSQGLSLSEVQALINVNVSDISRIKNHHLERFTIDRLIKIYAALDTQSGVGSILTGAGKKIRRICA